MNTSKEANVMALDDGYGDVKFDSRGLPVLIPSFLTSFKEKPKDDFSSSSKLQYLASEVDGKRYVVGDYAMKLDPNIRWIGGENKHADSRFPALLKTTLGLMCTGKHESIDLLMMNLPIRYDTVERRLQLENLANGTHQVSLSRDGVNFAPKVITVKNTLIKKQPFGSLCDAILDGNGSIVNRELAAGYNVIVDIGARTLNILTVDALEEQPELSIQTNDGMFTAYSQVGAYLESELNAIIPDGKLPQIIQARTIKGRDISPLIDTAYENQANVILSVLDRVLVNSWAQVTSVIFTGGGSDKQLLGQYLAKGVRNRANTLFMDRYANVRGLRKYGIYNAKSLIRKPSGISVKVGGHEYK
jgi:plasmid segregation protein ParM